MNADRETGNDVRRLLLMVGMLLAFASVLIGCRTHIVRFEGTSMLPGIKDGDRLLVERVSGEIRRGDIVVHIYPQDQTKRYVKRIVGVPGDTIEFRGGRVIVNGEFLDEPYVDRERSQRTDDRAPLKIGLDEYYVLGDNRDNSSDSRSWGTVRRSLILDRVKSKL